MEEVIENAFFAGVAKVGDGLSWVTANVIKWLAQYGVGITALQSKILTFVILGIGIYILLSVVTIGKKLVKWAIVAGVIFLAISVLISMFI